MIKKKDVAALVAATIKKTKENGAEHYAWRNSPEVSFQSWTQVQGWGENASAVEISAAEAGSIFQSKLNGAYSERFAMSVGTIAALVANGYNCRLVQFAQEEGTPFDASGWLVVIVETMPVFHVAPWDMDASLVKDQVEILIDNSHEDVSWKNTNKVGEFAALLQGSVEPGLDLVSIAQELSK